MEPFRIFENLLAELVDKLHERLPVDADVENFVQTLLAWNSNVAEEEQQSLKDILLSWNGTNGNDRDPASTIAQLDACFGRMNFSKRNCNFLRSILDKEAPLILAASSSAPVATKNNLAEFLENKDFNDAFLRLTDQVSRGFQGARIPLAEVLQLATGVVGKRMLDDLCDVVQRGTAEQLRMYTSGEILLWRRQLEVLSFRPRPLASPPCIPDASAGRNVTPLSTSTNLSGLNRDGTPKPTVVPSTNAPSTSSGLLATTGPATLTVSADFCEDLMLPTQTTFAISNNPTATPDQSITWVPPKEYADPFVWIHINAPAQVDFVQAIVTYDDGSALSPIFVEVLCEYNQVRGMWTSRLPLVVRRGTLLYIRAFVAGQKLDIAFSDHLYTYLVPSYVDDSAQSDAHHACFDWTAENYFAPETLPKCKTIRAERSGTVSQFNATTDRFHVICAYRMRAGGKVEIKILDVPVKTTGKSVDFALPNPPQYSGISSGSQYPIYFYYSLYTNSGGVKNLQVEQGPVHHVLQSMSHPTPTTICRWGDPSLNLKTVDVTFRAKGVMCDKSDQCFILVRTFSADTNPLFLCRTPLLGESSSDFAILRKDDESMVAVVPFNQPFMYRVILLDAQNGVSYSEWRTHCISDCPQVNPDLRIPVWVDPPFDPSTETFRHYLPAESLGQKLARKLKSIAAPVAAPPQYLTIPVSSVVEIGDDFESAPVFHTDNGPARCFVDGEEYFRAVFNAILNARSEILICDWWLSVEVLLVRRPVMKPCPAGITLLEALEMAHNRGVKVKVMIYRPGDWLSPLHLAPKQATEKLRKLGIAVIEISAIGKVVKVWSYHQKMVIVDCTTAFVGGIDLCFGRWDTQSHSLFRSDTQIHPGVDFYNPQLVPIKNSLLEEPEEDAMDEAKHWRQPWHDVHAQAGGNYAVEAAKLFRNVWESHLDIPFRDFDNVASDIHIREQCVALSLSSIWAPGISKHDSIMVQYRAMIDGAERYIYIENQFLISQSTGETEVTNTLADLIVKKLRDNRDLRLIIGLPCHPEGDPTGISSKPVMQLQQKTIDHILAGAPRQVFFFSLLKWDKKLFGNRCRVTTNQIYIHSKLMIVDDSMILGSANFNDRSLLGDRDAEVALVFRAVRADKSVDMGVRGLVHNLRCRLWKEHLGERVFAELVQTAQIDTPTFDVTKVFDAFETLAHNNTECAAQYFKSVPSNQIQSGSDLQLGPIEYQNGMEKFQGQIIQHPTQLLKFEKGFLATLFGLSSRFDLYQ